jgi:cell division protein ZapE
VTRAVTLPERYAAELAARGWQRDAAQAAAVARLEQLRIALQSAASARAPWRALLRRLPFAGKAPPPGPRGVYLWGGVGRGKTWLMDLFFDSLANVPRRRIHFHHLMRDVHATLATIRQREQPLQRVAARMARRARLWCLDELHVHDIADAMLVGGLFEALLAAGCTLVITSNLPPAGLYREGLQRARFLPAIALLEQRLELLQVEAGTDYRLRQLRQADIYLPTAAADTPARLEALFGELAGAHADTGRHLQVGGRSLQPLRRAGDVAWFSFATLCEGARSAADYAELAADFHTVFLSEVPLLGELQDDAARRLVTLVDEFYDQGVKLVVSAAAAPAALYRGERLAFEFQRTASRLVEMQSEHYLARPHLRDMTGVVDHSTNS